MFNNNKINNSRYVKNARDAHIAFGANPALGSIQTKDARFFCCGNSAADISKPHTIKWGTLADDVFRRRTSRCLQNLVRQPVPFKCMGFWYIRSRISAAEKKRASLVWIDPYKAGFTPKAKRASCAFLTQREMLIVLLLNINCLCMVFGIITKWV